MELFCKVLESWKDEKAFEKRLENGLDDKEVSEYIQTGKNKRLKKIIRAGKFRTVFVPGLIASDNGKALSCYVYSQSLTNAGKAYIAHVPYQKLEEWGINIWLDMELSIFGLSQKVYQVLMACGNDYLIDSYRELRRNVNVLSYFLLPYIPYNAYGWEDFNQLLSALLPNR